MSLGTTTQSAGIVAAWARSSSARSKPSVKALKRAAKDVSKKFSVMLEVRDAATDKWRRFDRARRSSFHTTRRIDSLST
jgi:hypothetical protein